MAGDKARDKAFDALAFGLQKIGLKPNHLTLLQIPIYVLMVRAGLRGEVWDFVWYQVVVMLLDGMDGTLARRTGTASRSGAILDASFDLAGIVLVVFVAAHLYPQYIWWLYATLAINLLLYAQNYQLDEKAVSYVRGPVVGGMVFESHWPGIMWFGIGIPLVAASIILLVRWLRDPLEEPPERREPGPEPYQPGFSVGSDK